MSARPFTAIDLIDQLGHALLTEQPAYFVGGKSECEDLFVKTPDGQLFRVTATAIALPSAPDFIRNLIGD